MQKIRPLLALALVAAVIITSGCSTSSERDPVKVEQVKAAIVPLASSVVRRAIVKNPELAPFARQLATILLGIQDTQRINPTILAELLQQALVANGLLDPSKEEVQTAIDLKNALVAIYAIYHAERLEADVSEREFLLSILEVLGRVINQGVNDAGL